MAADWPVAFGTGTKDFTKDATSNYTGTSTGTVYFSNDGKFMFFTKGSSMSFDSSQGMKLGNSSNPGALMFYISASSNITVTVQRTGTNTDVNLDYMGSSKPDNLSSSNLTTAGTNCDTESITTNGTDYTLSKSAGAAGYYKIYASKRFSIKSITIATAGAQVPSFSPVTGSSIASESNVDITSTNATTVYYKWTMSSETPADGWSNADADANGKITVSAPEYDAVTPANNTRYLHAYGEKSSTAGTAGYAQYTITAPDTEAPTLSSTTPEDADDDVAVSGDIVLTFNENVACTTNATLTPEGGDPIALTPVVSGTTVTYSYENLDYNKSHTFNLAANSVADGSGNQYASAVNFSFTTVQETCATPVFTVYGNKVVKITCATDGATIYYGGSDVKTGVKTEYTDLFIPASNGTIYAYATKTGTIDSELASKAITLPVAGDLSGCGKLMMTLQPEKPRTEYTYPTTGFQKGGYALTIENEGTIKNSAMENYPDNFKISAGKDVTITPPANVTIKAIKIVGANNNSTTDTKNVQVGSGFTISGSAALMPKNVFVGGKQVMSEVVVKPDTPTEGEPVVFKLEKESRLYVEVYGETSATSATINVAKEYTTYIPTYNLDFTSATELTAYIATSATASTVTMIPVDNVPAGTPVVLKSTSLNTDIAVNLASTTNDVSSNKLKIGDGLTVIGGTGKYDYILSNGKFHHASEGALPVGKCYLHLDSAPAEANELTMDFGEGNVTSISVLENEAMPVGNYYDLQGRKVSQPTKGLYIVNGKKVIIK